MQIRQPFALFVVLVQIKQMFALFAILTQIRQTVVLFANKAKGYLICTKTSNAVFDQSLEVATWS